MKPNIFQRVACLQVPIQQGNVEAGLQEFHRLLETAAFAEQTLVVLPELWAAGFDYPNINLLAEQTPRVLAELQRKAAESRIWFAGSLPEKQDTQEAGAICNSLFFVGPEGVTGKYQKQHIFRLWHEDRFFVAGNAAQTVQTPFGPVGALICYDLRFPELSRRQIFSGAKLLIVSAQWPAIRLAHWRILLRARAVENQVFLVACNGSGRV
ncbi:MAG: nitrilase, partial [Candidatus Electrothrix sp. EH2]|nr:nitrilase [Candidatus Electrothrix sp. EH2]